MPGKNALTSRRAFLRQSLAVTGGLSLPLGAGSSCPRQDESRDFDVVIYGGTPAAITAAVQVRRMRKTVAIVCPEQHLGGLTTSGLGWTDCKNGNAIGGLAREFYHRVWLHYRNPDAWDRETRDTYVRRKIGAQPGPAVDETNQVMWTFEPKAAERVLEAWLAEEKVPVFRGECLDRAHGVRKQNGRILSLTTLSGKTFRGKVFIDAGYEGDLMAASGVRYRVGRDSAREYDEPLNGIRFPIRGVDRYYSDDDYRGVDPYVVPGKPESGLLPGIESEIKGAVPLGDADPNRLQSFNYRLCLTTEPTNRVPFPKPDSYDESQYELLFRLLAAGQESLFTTQATPNRKTDSNNQGKMSGDYVGGSFSLHEGLHYSDASDERRNRMREAHRRYHQGLLWTLANHPRVPETLRKKARAWGLAQDEFTDNGNWPYQLYIREARRLVGMGMVTQHHVQKKPGYAVNDPIGMGSYSLDSHVVRRIVVDGRIRDEGGFYVWWDTPYPLPYSCMVPRREDATNLLVPVTISATHAAFGSIRMEPTYMILGQAAGTAAALAIQRDRAVQDVEYGELAQRLTADGQVLAMPKVAKPGQAV